MENLTSYLEANKIGFKVIASMSLVEIDSEVYYLLKPDKSGKLFDEDFELIVSDIKNEFDNYVFFFGGKYYWTPKGTEKKPQLNLLKYLGKTSHKFVDSQFPFLGIRGQYEILNGSRLYDDWIKKAKFLGIDTLGICEKNTLAGILSFQLKCQESEIKSIIGATYTVDQDDYRYDIKLYVQNEEGWRNLLSINKEINVTNQKFIYEKDLLKYLDNLHIVLDPKSLSFSKIPNSIKSKKPFYQFDSVVYGNNDRDKEYLLNLKEYIESSFEPISIMDAFYLDQEDYEVKIKLNLISGVQEYKSDNQYFKDIEDYYREVEDFFSDSDALFALLEKAIGNVYRVCDICSFLIDTSKRHLPRYRLNEEESKKYKDKYDLFWELIEEGIKERVPKDKFDEYIDRVELEFKVIESGDVLDYFLILYDITRWAREHDILVGIGRGSAGGSLVSYLLKITHIDPIKFGLLFERFLNEGRVSVSLPDIDVDFAASRRDEVKRYMEERYGVNQVCSIGTHTTLQLKAALRELCRLENIPIEDINYFSTVLDIETGSVVDIFKKASKVSRLRGLIRDYPQIVNYISLILGQPKAASVHACATLILPREKDIYSWIPVKIVNKDDQDILVSEWEGDELDSAGFLKEDILGIQQLDKFQTIIDLIKENVGEVIDIYSIPLDDQDVYEKFRNGLNSDIFHFGSPGLTQYCIQLQPQDIEDLIAGISLYRPGSMESNFHKQYLELKSGEEEPQYDYLLEEVTKSTYGLYIYQEQIMQVYQILGGFSLVEADDIRRAMGKMKEGLIDSYSKKFINEAVNRGCPLEMAQEIQKKAERFAHYSFNRSHAAAYAITGYIGQWFKVHYPIYFWVTVFKYLTEEKKIPTLISEIFRSGDINIASPHINYSGFDSNVNYETKTIYWKLSSINQCGEKAVEQITTLREKSEYFSFEEFLSRNIFTGSKVNKQVIEHLVLSGVFDEIENIKDPVLRISLIIKYREIYKVKVDEEKDLFSTSVDYLKESWWWLLQQKRLSSLAFFDYKTLTNNYLKSDFKWVDHSEFYSEDFDKVDVKIGGYVLEVDERVGRKGEYANIILESNYEMFQLKFWTEEWECLKGVIVGSEKSLMLVSGKIGFDSWKKTNVLFATQDTEVIILE